MDGFLDSLISFMEGSAPTVEDAIPYAALAVAAIICLLLILVIIRTIVKKVKRSKATSDSQPATSTPAE